MSTNSPHARVPCWITKADCATIGFEGLVEALRIGLNQGAECPARQILPCNLSASAQLLIMTAWQKEVGIIVKVITSFPSLPAGSERSTVTLCLYDDALGHLLAVFDAVTLTCLRTAAISALAAQYLARRDSRILLMVGAGSLAPYLIRAHCSVRPIERVIIWNRTAAHAERLAASLTTPGIAVSVASSLPAAIRAADIITTATRSVTPLITHENVRPGTHVDLVGSYTPEMQECDGALLGWGRIVVDHENALETAGELVQAFNSGLIHPDSVGNLAALVRGDIESRLTHEEVTIFKSIGSAIEDLYTARFALAELSRGRVGDS